MKGIIICPDRPARLGWLAHRSPVCLVPVLGNSLLSHHLEAFAEAGMKEVLVLASDRPEQIRAIVGKGERWGMNVQVVAESREISAAEAQARYGRKVDGDVPKADWTIVVADGLPGDRTGSALATGKDFHEAAQRWMSQAARRRVGVREAGKNVWVGMGAKIDPTAKLIGPCWIGEGAQIGSRAVVGPFAIIEDHAEVEHRACVSEGWVGSGTCVNVAMHVRCSLAWGNQLDSWETGLFVEVSDASVPAKPGWAAVVKARFLAGTIGAIAALWKTLRSAARARLSQTKASKRMRELHHGRPLSGKAAR